MDKDNSLKDMDSSELAEALASPEVRKRLAEIMETLTDRERQVVDFRYGLTGGYSQMLEETGRRFNVTPERIREIEAKALRKLRHPSRTKSLGDFRDD